MFLLLQLTEPVSECAERSVPDASDRYDSCLTNVPYVLSTARHRETAFVSDESRVILIPQRI